MKLRQQQLFVSDLNNPDFEDLSAIQPQLVLVFAGITLLDDPRLFSALKSAFPSANLMGCSTAGEISVDGVDDNSVVVTAIHFEQPAIRMVTTNLLRMEDSELAGQQIGEQLNPALEGKSLRHVMVLGQGVGVNGSALIQGIASVCNPRPQISGGLAGDGGAFKRTLTLSSTAVSDQQIVAVGFYGDSFEFGYGSFGGWQPFGPARKVTRAEGNVLFELDGEPALEVYKRYLGDYVSRLPASGLLFPFLMLNSSQEEAGLIRTILGVDEAQGSLILAGDILNSGYLKLMHASTEALVDGATAAAEAAQLVLGGDDEVLTLLVSCVGRKLVMGARVDEEIEAVGDVYGSKGLLAGFYSYGEISPFLDTTECKLHNQTMTITTLREV